jgi:hypothetical protein
LGYIHQEILTLDCILGFLFGSPDDNDKAIERLSWSHWSTCSLLIGFRFLFIVVEPLLLIDVMNSYLSFKPRKKNGISRELEVYFQKSKSANFCQLTHLTSLSISFVRSNSFSNMFLSKSGIFSMM